MTEVQTVQGPIDDCDLGIVLVHEHLRFRDEAVAANWPSRYDSEAETVAAITAVTAARARGVATIVEPTAMLGGRDVRFLRNARHSCFTGSCAASSFVGDVVAPHVHDLPHQKSRSLW